MYDSNNNVLIYAGIGAGVLLCVIAFCICCRRKDRKQQKQQQQCTNPAEAATGQPITQKQGTVYATAQVVTIV